MSDWTSIPLELFMLITQKLSFINDFVNSSIVCSTWLTKVKAIGTKPSLPTRIPYLMLAEDTTNRNEDPNNDNNNDIKPRTIFNPSTKNVYELELPELSRRKCYGVNYGWLMTLGSDLVISLVHPFSRNQITLPPFLTFSEHIEYDDSFPPQNVIDIFVHKAVLSSNPYQDDNFHVMAIYGQRRILAYATRGVNAWTNVDVPYQNFSDVVCYKGQFCAVDIYGNLVVCDLRSNPTPRTWVFASATDMWSNNEEKYLVETSGDLLLIERIYGGYKYDIETESESEVSDDDDILLSDSEVDEEAYNNGICKNYTTKFVVRKMEWRYGSNSEFKWVEVKSLGDYAIFLGNNASISLSKSAHNGRLQDDCIYFTENNVLNYQRAPGGGGRDMGVFDMQSESIGTHYDGKSVSPLSPPLWLV